MLVVEEYINNLEHFIEVYYIDTEEEVAASMNGYDCARRYNYFVGEVVKLK